MEISPSRRPLVIKHGTTNGVPLGSSGRGALMLYNQPVGDTGYALIEGSHPVGEPRIPDHVHARHEETFLVLARAYRVRVGDRIIHAEAGDYVFVPRGTAHSYRNSGPAPARILNIMSPADGVNLLVELGALAGTSLTDDAVAEIFHRHSAVLVPPLDGW